MTRYLLLSFRFLDGRYHGQTDSGESPEWPPSPFRVFQALIAGNAPGGAIPQPLREALIWLEQLPPPDILAPPGRPADRPLLTYVLNNTSDRAPNSRAPKTIRPTLLDGDRLVEYVWAFDDAPPHARLHADTVSDAARHVRALGWGIDLAIGHGRIVDQAPPQTQRRTRYCPARPEVLTGLDLRTPTNGSLVSLERTFAEYLRRYETPGITRFESAGALYEPRPYSCRGQRPFAAFRLVTLQGEAASISPRLIAPFVGVVRELLGRPLVTNAIGAETVERDLMGHPKASTPTRVSILPLPTIRDGHTDGRIRRVMLAQLRCGDGDLCHRLARILHAQTLRPLPGEDRIPVIELERIATQDAVLSRYAVASRQWTSVTPVLLPGYDDRKQHQGDHQKRLARAEQLLCRAMVQAGIDVPAQIELSRVPWWPGSLHVRDYRPREKLQHYPRYHVRLSFDTPITGPLAIGAGRHAGFGILAASEE